MRAQQLFADGIVRAFAAGLVVMAGGICACSQESPVQAAPLAAGVEQFAKGQPAPTPGSLYTSPPPSMPRSFSPRRPLQAGVADTDPIAPADQFRLGNNYVGIQMERSVQTPDLIRRRDCPMDEDCTDYPAPTKSGTPKPAAKSFRKPYIGLSVTTPLRP